MLSRRLAIALTLLAVWVIYAHAGYTATSSDTQAPKRVEFKRFSLKPPPGDGWVLEKKREAVIYRKALSATHTLGAAVYIAQTSIPRTSPPDTPDPKLIGQWAAQEATRRVAFLDALVRRKEQPPTTGRIRPISFVSEYVFGKKATCQVFDATSEDHGVPGWEGRAFLLRERGLICLTPPDRGDWVLHGNYSERWLTGEEPLASFQEDAEAFIKSVRFDGKLAPKKPYLED